MRWGIMHVPVPTIASSVTLKGRPDLPRTKNNGAIVVTNH